MSRAGRNPEWQHSSPGARRLGARWERVPLDDPFFDVFPELRPNEATDEVREEEGAGRGLKRTREKTLEF